MPKTTPIYWRGDPPRAYGNFRRFESLGGRHEPLVAPGEQVATMDPDMAQKLYAARLDHYKKLQAGVLYEVPAAVPLGPAARDHLIGKKARDEATDGWLQQAEAHLRRATTHFGADRDLKTIRVTDVKAYAAWLRMLPNGRKGTMGQGAVRHHINSLSNLFAALVEAEVLEGNPVAAWSGKPRDERRGARGLEGEAMARLLVAAQGAPRRRSVPFRYPLLATLALTGGRVSEVLGLEVDDVNRARGTVTFRPNTWRRLKTRTSHRVVPLWPQLREILDEYLVTAPPGRLLFPVYRGGVETMVTDFRRQLDAVAARAGWKAGEIRGRMFRHSYCAARLQTLDHGARLDVHGGEGTGPREYDDGGGRVRPSRLGARAW